jgi:hypothetical protein
MKHMTTILCLVSIIVMLYKIDNTISEIKLETNQVEDKFQEELIHSLQLEIMEMGAELDSMYLKYDK